MKWEHERLNIKEQVLSGHFDFEELALKLFFFQAQFNIPYKEYIRILRIDFTKVNTLDKIPFLPIGFFKKYKIVTGEFLSQMEFYSSGTTQSSRSIHYVRDVEVYKNISSLCFQQIMGEGIEKYMHFGLLPSYASNRHSSLLFMLDHFIHKGGGGYYHDDRSGLAMQLMATGEKKIILWGVSYALYRWDLPLPKLENLIIIETGGMKGMQKEIIRKELHVQINTNFNTNLICSEYGMTELLSQSYSLSEGQFRFPSSVKVLIRSVTDPFEYETSGSTGVLNIIDLANLDSCAFIATDDLGKLNANGNFEVLGRLYTSDIRGCNLLIT
jgi:hypothetical protein